MPTTIICVGFHGSRSTQPTTDVQCLPYRGAEERNRVLKSVPRPGKKLGFKARLLVKEDLWKNQVLER